MYTSSSQVVRGSRRSELAKKALKSSAQHFIDMNNNAPSPYDALREGRPITPDRLMRYGLSGYNTQRKNGSYAYSGINQDGEGRAGYLLRTRMKNEE